MDTIINVGLNVGEEECLTSEEIVDVARELGMLVYEYKVHRAQGATERRFVARIAGATKDALFTMSGALGQDCIAVYDLAKCKGALIGPDAKRWGKFNPDKFSVL
jgi:hypothetical protein